MSNNIGTLTTPSGKGASIEVTENGIRIKDRSRIYHNSYILYGNNTDDYDNRVGLLVRNGNDADTTLEPILILRAHNSHTLPGSFSLACCNTGNTGRHSLVGQPNHLTWIGKDIDTIYNSSNNHIRYTSGLLICWGSIPLTVNTSSWAITFPSYFLNSGAEPTVTVSTSNMPQNGGITNITYTGFVYNTESVQSIIGNLKYIAIGRWK